MERRQAEELLAHENPEAMFADGFDDCILGVCQQFNRFLVLYSYQKCVDLLMARDGMSLEEAIEFMDYNVLGSWVGENTPAFLMDI